MVGVSMATMRESQALASIAGGLATLRGRRVRVRRAAGGEAIDGARPDFGAGHEESILIRVGDGERQARPFERLDDDHPAATAAAARRRDVFGLAVGLGAWALGSGSRRREQLPSALDVVRSKRAGDEAVVADAVEAAGQHVQEERRMNSWAASVMVLSRSRPSMR